jgi:hypothetical protein
MVTITLTCRIVGTDRAALPAALNAKLARPVVPLPVLNLARPG